MGTYTDRGNVLAVKGSRYGLTTEERRELNDLCLIETLVIALQTVSELPGFEPEESYGIEVLNALSKAGEK